MKIIALYLPQFHNIPENDEWWGDGFTEWTNVKAAKPLFDGHEQPRIPLDNNYYNLLDDNVKIWQANLAKEYGIYGFCYYHYWFDGKMLLEKPMEQMLANKDIDLPFCICWANEDWTRAWIGKQKVLIEQRYGKETEWKVHFDYLLSFFKDERYIKVDGKPLFFIYKANLIECLKPMLECWQQRAQEEGLPGICFAYRAGAAPLSDEHDELFDLLIEWQPSTTLAVEAERTTSIKKKLRRFVGKTISFAAGDKARRKIAGGIDAFDSYHGPLRLDYDSVWTSVLNTPPLNKKSIPGAFCAWDNTSRHGKSGSVCEGDSPEKFKRYLSQQIYRAKTEYNKDMMVLFAWNEWAECGYLEPDERYGYGYLEAVKTALAENDEL